MTALHHRESLPPRPDGPNTVDTFLISDRAAELVDFLVTVLEAEEVPEARTLDHDGLLHSEVRVGDSVLVVADTSAWTDDAATDESADWSDVASPELEYIHSTLTEAVHTLRDPRSRAV